MKTEPEKKGVFIGRRTLIALVVIIVIAFATVSWQVYLFIQKPNSSTLAANLQPMELTLVGFNGTQIVLDASEIAALPFYSGRAGFINSVGVIIPPANYTGVTLIALCDLVGGFNESNSLKITASDGYSMVYTYAQINGDFLTFDPVTGNEVNHTQPLTPMLAYFKNGQNLSSDEGPLRLVIIGKEVLLTEGHNWVKFVVKIEICSSVKEWALMLNGAIVENMSRVTFESGANADCHGKNWTDSDGNIWSGISLWRLVGRVDDNNSHGTGAFNTTLVKMGYTVKVLTGDGYSREFNSTFVAENDNIIIANKANGEALPDTYWPLKLVGSAIAESDMLRNVVEIQIIFSGS
jgi:DMSO/TMAO reductase YedYZ molybdopterin-dependent catalytic subunit